MKVSTSAKRKLHKALGTITNPVTMLGSMLLAFAFVAGPEMYREITQSQEATTAQEQEFATLEKRVQGIAPMRKYVAQLQEQAEVVLKLPADALPPGTDAVKLRAQGEKLSAAFNAEVTNTAVAIAFSPHISYSDANRLGFALQRGANQKLDYMMAREQGGADFDGGFHACQAEITAQPGFTAGPAAVQQLQDCVKAKAVPANTILFGGIFAFVAVMGTSLVLRPKLAKQIEEEDAALAAAAPQAAPAPVINTATGQDITVKPIKISAKTPGPAA